MNAAATYIYRWCRNIAAASAVVILDAVAGPPDDLTRPDTQPPCPECGRRLA